MKKLLTIIALTASLSAQGQTPAQNAAIQRNIAAQDRASRQRGAEHRAMIADMNNRKVAALTHPWWQDPAWRACTNRLAQLRKVVAVNREEYNLLCGAGAGKGERALLLQANWQSCERVRKQAEKEMGEIEGKWRLLMWKVTGGGK